MHLEILPLSVACLVLFLSSVANGDPLKVLSAPNLLRIGATENIFVECHDCSGADIDVQIVVKLFSTGALELDSTTVTLTDDNNFQAFGEIKILADEFENDPTLKQHVSLEARFPDGTSLKKVVLVSFQSGYIFIQTNKPLYTPNSRVHYRVFGLTSGMKPFGLAYDEDSIININIVTPDEIILPVGPVSLALGIHSGSYILPEIVSTGMWTVVATFQNSKQNKYSAEFEVKEYVLPSFEVTITPDKPFFYVDDEMLTIDIRATYLFGKEVEGSAYVVFGMFDKNKEKHSFPGSIQRVINGIAQATLTRTQIQETYPDIENEVKSSIYVAVTVLTESGSELVEAEKQGINIVASPYTINLKKTPKYFKPTMFFEVLVYVEYPDGSPAADVPVRVDPGDIEVTTTKNGLARVLINPSGSSPRLDITAKTADPQVSNNRQTSATMTALPYNSGIGSYLHIGVGSSEVRLGDDLQITLSLNAQTTTRDITYLIQSRGQLVKHGRFRVALTTITMTLPVTKEMLPSFRIIAYHRDRVEVVSDSVWVDVIDTCMGSLKLVPASALPSEPRQTFRYTITGDPGATVGLVAVDKGVYALNNKHRLTQRKVWDVVKKADTGCTPGGGEDSMNVFYDAGLLFQSDLIGTADRQVHLCSVCLSVSEYKDSLLRQCCLDGMAETSLSYSCERRKEYISDGKACADAFLKCCQELNQRQTESKTARGPRDIVFTDSRQIVTRTIFPEGWLWADYKLPLCPDKDPKCKTTSLKQRIPLRDSITTWHLTGISLSPTHGICIDDTLKIVVLKNFFIDLRLPYAAVRGEQIEIKAILHNYLLDDITVLVYLKEVTDVCSLASKQEEYTQTVSVAAEGTRSVSFLIIPMRHGKFPIEVKASVGDLLIDDGVRKELLVVVIIMVMICFQNFIQLPESKQVEIITNPIDVANIVSNKPTILEIYVKGSQVNLLVEKVLSGSSTGRLIRQPRGNGEQNMMSMTLPLIAAMYLEKTKQWDTVGLSKRDNALEYIKTGYQNELAFRKVDGAFSTSIGTTGLSWLTSYVAKLFSMAFTLVDIDRNTICGAIKWVILRSQQPDGRFMEIGPVIHGEMMGDVRGSDSDASMTAFSLIAIQEARPICEDIVRSMTGSINTAVGYLEGRLPSLTNPYAVAMVSYALANENKLNKEILYRFVSQDSTHWPVANHELFTLEATAYALLALVKVKEFEDAAPIVKWLNTQRTVEGGYGSTQSTIMVYQAVAEYWVNAKEQEHEMDIEIQVPNRMIPIRINKKYTFWTTWVNRLSKATYLWFIHTFTHRRRNQPCKVTARLSGAVRVRFLAHGHLNTKPGIELATFPEKSQPAPPPELSRPHFFYSSSRYRDADKDAGMTILDIGLPSGYTPDIADLNQSAIKQRQTMKVGVLQPATVSVYEFYNQKHCVKYYHPAGDRVKMQVHCQEDVCKCNKEECSIQTKGEINTKERIEKACDPEARIDYVYKITMESYEEQNSTDVYKMRINQVIKEGSSDKELNDKLQTFIGYSHCREILNLELNKSYLIMGRYVFIRHDGHRTPLYEYVLREKTWIEYWPTELECRTPKYRPTCEGIEDLNLKLVFDGCMEWRYGIMD
uniref:Uncharacterized protein n=1 Tax=Gadus morhua TaxID=8049 RepID=A0A8C5A1M9_GADMO